MENAENTAVLAMNFAVIGLLLKKVLKNKAMATTTKINAMMNRTREQASIKIKDLNSYIPNKINEYGENPIKNYIENISKEINHIFISIIKNIFSSYYYLLILNNKEKLG